MKLVSSNYFNLEFLSVFDKKIINAPVIVHIYE